jgi:hypothetical protein
VKGFIKIELGDGSTQYVAIDEIRSWAAEDKYHPNQGVRIMLKDGTTIRAGWRHNVESLAEQIAEATP